MRCGKCQGLIVTEYEESRCLNCGCRPFEVVRAPDEPKQGLRRRCTNCQEKAVAGHNYCQTHLDYFVEYGRNKKTQREQAQRLMQELA